MIDAPEFIWVGFDGRSVNPVFINERSATVLGWDTADGASAPKFIRADLSAAAKEQARAEGYAQALKDAAEACNGEHLEDDTGTECDIAYDNAVSDCIAAIRALIAEEEAKA